MSQNCDAADVDDDGALDVNQYEKHDDLVDDCGNDDDEDDDDGDAHNAGRNNELAARACDDNANDGATMPACDLCSPLLFIFMSCLMCSFRAHCVHSRQHACILNSQQHDDCNQAQLRGRVALAKATTATTTTSVATPTTAAAAAPATASATATEATATAAAAATTTTAAAATTTTTTTTTTTY